MVEPQPGSDMPDKQHALTGPPARQGLMQAGFRAYSTAKLTTIMDQCQPDSADERLDLIDRPVQVVLADDQRRREPDGGAVGVLREHAALG